MGPQKQSCQSKAQGRFSAHVCIHAARLGSLNIIVAIRLMIGHMMQQMQKEMAAAMKAGRSSARMKEKAMRCASASAMSSSSRNAIGAMMTSS